MILQALVKYYENLAEQGKVSRLGCLFINLFDGFFSTPFFL